MDGKLLFNHYYQNFSQIKNNAKTRAITTPAVIRPIKMSEETAKNERSVKMPTYQVGLCPHMRFRLQGSPLVIPVIPGALGENCGTTEGETSMEEDKVQCQMMIQLELLLQKMNCTVDIQTGSIQTTTWSHVKTSNRV